MQFTNSDLRREIMKERGRATIIKYSLPHAARTRVYEKAQNVTEQRQNDLLICSSNWRQITINAAKLQEKATMIHRRFRIFNE